MRTAKAVTFWVSKSIWCWHLLSSGHNPEWLELDPHSTTADSDPHPMEKPDNSCQHPLPTGMGQPCLSAPRGLPVQVVHPRADGAQPSGQTHTPCYSRDFLPISGRTMKTSFEFGLYTLKSSLLKTNSFNKVGLTDTCNSSLLEAQEGGLPSILRPVWAIKP